MSERGVFAVDRGIWSDPDFPSEPFSEREAWLWLVSEAAWRETSVRIGSKRIELKRGECAFSTRFMASKWKWSEARVRRFLKRRSDLNQLCTKTDAGATHITICKYDAFQRVGTISDAPATQERRSSDAKKKQGNIQTSSEPDGSSVRTERAGRGSRVDGFEPDISVATDMGMSAPQARLEAETFTDFWRGKAGKDGVKLDWPATWRNWIRGSLKRDGPRLVHDRDRPPPQEHMRDRLKRTILEDQPDVRPFADYSTIEGQAYRR